MSDYNEYYNIIYLPTYMSAFLDYEDSLIT